MFSDKKMSSFIRLQEFMSRNPASAGILTSLRFFLFPFSLLFYCIVSVRNLFFDLNLLKRYRVPGFVLSVGNLSTGGTGKTPMTDFLLSYFINNGYKVSLISRGYGRKSNGPLIFYPENDKSVPDSLSAGDEVAMLARRHKNIVIGVGKDKTALAGKISADYNPDIFILDDGFQSRSLERNFDIVMIDATKPPWQDFFLPSGNLREPIFALERADAIVVTRTDPESEQLKMMQKLHSWLRCPVFFAGYSIVEFRPFFPEKFSPFSPNAMRGKKVILASGIANPYYFEFLMRKYGIEVLRHFISGDHFVFSEKNFEDFIDARSSSCADAIVLTEKDYSRIACYPFVNNFEEVPLYYPVIRIDFSDNREEEFLNLINRAIRR